ncbi:hypothetical protein ACJRO7_029018 [Eucalyptus globulus]|uniref:Eukaryotic translation initiation factor 3 subunit G N-terminal domain-containing protein n=1 Tax=Eucalyptus globulus TaxID=34317 RepID=A0ABD3JWJ3_EUCGL
MTGTKSEETKVAGDNLAQLGKGGAVLMVCRTCGKKGDHWTSRCPYKDLAQPVETFVDKPAAAKPTSTKGAYVPPSMRAGAEQTGAEMRRRNEENSVRVTNLSRGHSRARSARTVPHVWPSQSCVCCNLMRTQV